MTTNTQTPWQTTNKTLKKICLSDTNINPIRNKLDGLLEFTYGYVDFLAVSETKLDSSFPTGQFNLPKFRTPYRKDILGKSGDYLFILTVTFHLKC